MSGFEGAAPVGDITEASQDLQTGNHKSTESRAAHKWERVLRELLKGPRTSRELECEPAFDHVAHSTAAELRKKGIGLDTEIIEISGYAGLPARIARYSLTPSGREYAIKLLGGR